MKCITFSGIINNVIIKPWWGVGDALLFQSNNHMDPNGAGNPIQSLPAAKIFQCLTTIRETLTMVIAACTSKCATLVL